MSIKIYQAWRVEKISTMKQLMDWTEDLNARLSEHLLQETRRRYPNKEAYRNFFTENTGNPDGVHKVKILICPARRGINILLENDRFSYFQVFESLVDQGKAKEWGYWDNVDEDDTVSARVWSARRRDWEAFCARNITFAEGALIKEFCAYLSLPYEAFPSE